MGPTRVWFAVESRGLLIPEALRDPDHPTVLATDLTGIIRDMEPGDTIMIRCVSLPGPKDRLP